MYEIRRPTRLAALEAVLRRKLANPEAFLPALAAETAERLESKHIHRLDFSAGFTLDCSLNGDSAGFGEFEQVLALWLQEICAAPGQPNVTAKARVELGGRSVSVALNVDYAGRLRGQGE